MSEAAVTGAAPASTPNVAPVATGSTTETTPNVGGWPVQKVVGDDGLLTQPTDAQPGEGAEANPDDPWMPDEQLAGKKTKLKVDGKEIDCTVGDLHKYAQLGIAANSRMQEAARVRREAEDSHTMLAETMRSPDMFFQRLIETDEGAAIKWIDRLAQVAADRIQMSPQDRELDRYRRTEEYRQQEAQKQQQAQAQQKMNVAWNKALTLADLPDSPIGEAIAIAMKDRVQQARREGRNETPTSLAQFAKERRAQMEAAFQKTLTPAQRQAMITPQDLQQQARDRASKPMVPATAPRTANGQFAPQKQGPQFYDPYA